MAIVAPTTDLSDELLRRLADDLVRVDGVVAVALGGSRARGTHGPSSDYDLGVYSEPDRLDLAALGGVARAWAQQDVRIARPGEWGPWVDGGAWLTVHGRAVDWILRDVQRVAEQCRRAQAGEFGFHTQPGHPLGFLDVSYAGEVAIGHPLADPSGWLASHQHSVDPYPAALRRALVAHTWQVDFLLGAARKGAARGDAAYVALCCSQAAMFCAHGWHARAGVWVVNEKGVLAGVDRLGVELAGFSGAVHSVLGRLGETPDELLASVERLQTVLGDSVSRLTREGGDVGQS